MKRIVECVPNFSEGRRREVVEQLSMALTSENGVALLDCEMDGAHHRCVISVAGDPQAVARGVMAAVGKAVELIDLREHRGEHPRMGAVDVIPFVPIAGVTMKDCVELAESVGAEIAERYSIPVYLYEEAARLAERHDLAHVRKGEFERIREEIRSDPARRPDFGPSEIHPSAGAVAVGARFPLIAYNVYLDTPDVAVAKAVAKAVRHSSGGLRYVKALGFEIRERGQVQVSMNLTHFEGTPLFRAFEMVCREAERYGVAVASSEIVGLVPQKALDACSDFYLKLENFSPAQILENRLEETLSGTSSATDSFVDQVAAPVGAPGGGSAAAMAGSLAAALGEMVAGLTLGKKKYQPVEAQVGELRRQLHEARADLSRLVEEDAASYRQVMEAIQLPKSTAEERRERDRALAQATRLATETPMRTARASARVLSLLSELALVGNPNALSDAATGAQLSLAAIRSAYYNVLANLPGLDAEYARTCREEAAGLVRSGEEEALKVERLIAGKALG